jgi:hypothetical protein|tara:strand:- start:479 stop:976 length:498 start_codon:yes stop_codon:yes gene_type:complete
MDTNMMIDLDIVGINHPCQGIVIRDAVENAMMVLMPKREKPIYINVEIGLDEDMGQAAGYMVEGGENDEFEVILRQDLLKDIEELILTVTHECIHIKQYLRKELKDINVDEKIWRGELYNTRDTYYKDCPWEQEAYLLQMPIANEVLKKYEDNEWPSKQAVAAQQ